jgi:hypothetical protein
VNNKLFRCENVNCVDFKFEFESEELEDSESLRCEECGKELNSKKIPDRYQFFTSFESWCPMDHFFFAQAKHDPDGGSFLEKGKVAHLEAHGTTIEVYRGDATRQTIIESFSNYPSALRRMADIIEEHENKLKVIAEEEWSQKK